MHSPFRIFSGRVSARLLLLTFALLSASALASDHADPLPPVTSYPRELLDDGKLSKKELSELSAGITDLFVFPAKEDGTIAFFPPRDEYWTTDIAPEDRAIIDTMVPEQRALMLQLNKEEYAKYKTLKPEDGTSIDMLFQQARQRRFELQKLDQAQVDQIKYIIVIFCVRRELVTPPPAGLDLEPYTYSIYLDSHSLVSYDQKPVDDQPNRARYGGTIVTPTEIHQDLSIRVHLNNDATCRDVSYHGFKSDKDIEMFPNKEQKESALRDDPFIFPRFFRKNVIAMAFKIPVDAFVNGLPQQWLAWGTVSRGDKQIDHVGRSLRTQQPRFNFLNTIAPKDQVAALHKEQEHQFFLYDYLRRLGFDSFFEYRYWDYVPDVMIYNPHLRTRYPNGRLPTDDVAAILAQNGDTLLVELSYKSPTSQAWPRKTVNDKPFMEKFPYLAPPWKAAPPSNSAPDEATQPVVVAPVNGWNKLIIYLGVIGLLVLFGLFFFLGWLVAKVKYFGRRPIEYQ